MMEESPNRFLCLSVLLAGTLWFALVIVQSILLFQGFILFAEGYRGAHSPDVVVQGWT